MAHSIRLQCADAHGSVIRAETRSGTVALAYAAYGHDPRAFAVCPSLRFNGELREWLSGNYLLGNGYRAYSPVLLRFISPDDLSPFGEGGVNAYAYCAGDPINSVDPTGHMPDRKPKKTTKPRTGAPPEGPKKKGVIRKYLPIVDDVLTTAEHAAELGNDPSMKNRFKMAKQVGYLGFKYGPTAPVYVAYKGGKALVRGLTSALRTNQGDQVDDASSDPSTSAAPNPAARVEVAASQRTGIREESA